MNPIYKLLGQYMLVHQKQMLCMLRILHKKWKEMATKIGDEHLIRILSSGDAASNDIFYHNENIKFCLVNFHKSIKHDN